MLGTGSALVTRCYNTCFTLHTPEAMLLVDAGGGNGILAQLEKAGIKLGDVHHIFITHAHTDHIIGVLWVLRVYIQYAMRGMIEGQLHIYGHDKSLHVLRTMVELMLPAKLQQQIGTIIVLHELHAGDEWTVGDLNLTCFDILSTKEKQFGFTALLPDGQRLCCLGDEPYNPANEHYVKDVNWLLAEAFCLYDHRDIFKPYEKNHVTVKDAAEQFGFACVNARKCISVVCGCMHKRSFRKVFHRDFIWVRKSDYSKALIAEALRHLTNHRRWKERMRK